MAAPGENLRINSDRLWDSLMEMARKTGASPVPTPVPAVV